MLDIGGLDAPPPENSKDVPLWLLFWLGALVGFLTGMVAS